MSRTGDIIWRYSDTTKDHKYQGSIDLSPHESVQTQTGDDPTGTLILVSTRGIRDQRTRRVTRRLPGAK